MNEPANFWAHVAISGVPNECWLWNGSRNPKEYGRLFWKGQPKVAHRVAWELERGLIPAGLFVLHKCDNPPCVNPDHLFLGTANDNMQDMWAKGRHDRRLGERVPWSKLTAEKVREIRASYAAGESCPSIAKRYDVWPNAIWEVVKRRTWAHV